MQTSSEQPLKLITPHLMNVLHCGYPLVPGLSKQSFSKEVQKALIPSESFTAQTSLQINHCIVNTLKPTSQTIDFLLVCPKAVPKHMTGKTF